jgi:hypothetical protein
MHFAAEEEAQLVVAKQPIPDPEDMQEIRQADIPASQQIVTAQCSFLKQWRGINVASFQFTQDQAGVNGADRVHFRKILQYGEI